jgi:acyl carrier protein
MASIADVKTLIADQLGLSSGEVTQDSRIVEDLGAESSDIANIVAAIEDRFGVAVPEEEIQGFITVNDVYMGIQQHGG